MATVGGGCVLGRSTGCGCILGRSTGGGSLLELIVTTVGESDLYPESMLCSLSLMISVASVALNPRTIGTFFSKLLLLAGVVWLNVAGIFQENRLCSGTRGSGFTFSLTIVETS